MKEQEYALSNCLRTNRRRFVRGALVSSVALGYGVPTVSAQDGTASDGSTDAGMFCDVDMDMGFAATMDHLEDPDSERGGVAYVTSDGERTTDYVCATVDVRRLGLSLRDVSNDGLSYDYYQGPDDENAAPDEVFLIIERDGRLFVTFRNLDAGEPVERWNTRNVANEMGRGGWRAVEVSPDDIDLDGELAMTTNEVIIETITSPRDQSNTFSNVVRRFGGGANLLGVSIGAGWTTQGTVLDIFFDNLVVAGETFDVPIVLPMSAEFFNVNKSTAAFHARLQFASEAFGLSLDDIDPATLSLTGYTPIAPAVRGTDEQVAALGAEEANTGDISDLGYRADFSRRQLVDLLGTGTSTVAITGELAVDRPVSFVAVSELELR